MLKALRSHHGPDEEVPEVEESVLDQFLSTRTSAQPGRQLRLPVLEICSENTGAGKTQLLYYIVANGVLPEIHGSTILDGKSGSVIFIDTDGRFNVDRLVQVMQYYIESKKNEEDTMDGIDQLIERSLQHVHVFQPRTMSSFLETLSSLRDYLFEPSAHVSSNRAVNSIVIDSASAFYWDTRAALETERINALDAKAPGASAASMPPPKPNPYALLVNRLRAQQQIFSCAVIIASTATKHRNPNTGEENIRTLPAPWQTFPTTRLMVRRDHVRKFVVGIAWEEAEKDKLLRQAAVDQGHFVASSMSAGLDFKFAITKDGVRILDDRKEGEDGEMVMEED